MRVKLILPALTEATSPFFRPIKYSLFPPLGLATLAGVSLGMTMTSCIQDEHVETLDLNDAPDLVVDPGLHHLGMPRLSPRRPLPRAARMSRSAACTSRRCRRRPPRTPTPSSSGPAKTRGRGSSPTSGAAVPRRVYRSTTRTLAGVPPIRRDLIKRHLYLVPELHRRVARLSARLRLLLQGGVLRGRPLLLHADGRCRAGRDRAPARPSSLLPRRSSVRQPHVSPRRCSTACAGWGGCGRPPAPSTPCSRPVCSSTPSAAGLRSLFVGFETLNPANLRSSGSTRTCSRDYAEAIRRLHGLGVMINGSFVFGMDADDESVFERTVEWAIAQGIETATFHILTPYPGHSALSPSGRARAHHESGLGSVRHAARRLPAGADVGRGARTRLLARLP